MRAAISIILCLVGLGAAPVHAYGLRGHSLVGAIADRRLAEAAPAVGAKVTALIHGLTLGEAAVIADRIKSWDIAPTAFGLPNHPQLESELRAFHAANSGRARPSHHEFHYADVPVVGSEANSSGQIGRSEHDVVRMIAYCVRVLQGIESESNEWTITRPVALVLLAHYLGDIHQQLHVGAQYFDGSKTPFEPTAGDPGFGDRGGNDLTLFTAAGSKVVSAGKLHAYWDSVAVEDAFESTPLASVAGKLASLEPAVWRLTGDVATWAEQMADAILPVAREAHERLVYRRLRLDLVARQVTGGRAVEVRAAGRPAYSDWAASVVRMQIHTGGWRLAALLEAALPTPSELSLDERLGGAASDREPASQDLGGPVAAPASTKRAAGRNRFLHRI